MSRPYDSTWQRVRLGVLRRDGWRCRIGLPRCAQVADQVDHIIPLSEGGARLDPANLRAACGYCNAARNAMRGVELARALAADRDGRGPSRGW